MRIKSFVIIFFTLLTLTGGCAQNGFVWPVQQTTPPPSKPTTITLPSINLLQINGGTVFELSQTVPGTLSVIINSGVVCKGGWRITRKQGGVATTIAANTTEIIYWENTPGELQITCGKQRFAAIFFIDIVAGNVLKASVNEIEGLRVLSRHTLRPGPSGLVWVSEGLLSPTKK